ncbi:tetratricopeptide repeat protein [Lyngbya aestuarii]|uniref:tetratricopeptide repeat protein n=1 Tax=Lyngbya aestuarii TaxID=118322 RepID=UPI0004008209|nr:tetratricopeptide repeat protein [Lyngbya aestuarii]
MQGQAVSLLELGRIYDLLGDKQQALAFYNKSLPLWRQVENKAGEAATLTGICSCLQTRTPMLACQDNFLLTLEVFATFDALDRGASFYTIAIASRMLCDCSLPQYSFKQGKTFDRLLGDK